MLDKLPHRNILKIKHNKRWIHHLRKQTPFSPHLRTCKGKTRNRRIKKEVYFKTVNFMTPMEGILVLRRDHIGYILNIHVHFYFSLYTLIRFTYRANLTNLV